MIWLLAAAAAALGVGYLVTSSEEVELLEGELELSNGERWVWIVEETPNSEGYRATFGRKLSAAFPVILLDSPLEPLDTAEAAGEEARRQILIRDPESLTNISIAGGIDLEGEPIDWRVIFADDRYQGQVRGQTGWTTFIQGPIDPRKVMLLTIEKILEEV